MKEIYAQNVIRHKPWKKAVCALLSFIIAFGAAVTMLFGNVFLSDYVDFGNLITANAAESDLRPVPVFYRHGELVGLYRVNYTDKTELQYKIGEEGEWTAYKVPFTIPAHKTTKVYARIGDDGKITYASFSNTKQAIGVYSEENTDFEFSYNNIDFGYTRIYNSADRDWFESIHSKVLVTNSRLEVTLPDSSKYPMIRKDADTYVDELNGYTLTKADNAYVFDDGRYKYYFAIKSLQSVAYLSAIEDYAGNKLNLNRTANTEEIAISDGAGRSFALSDFRVIDAPDGSGTDCYSQKEITDPNGNKIEYTTKYDRYMQVKDQAGVLLGKYEYKSPTDYTLTRSTDKTIAYYDNGRIKQITYDNGAWLKYTYDDDHMTYTTLTSSDETTKTVYNDAFLPVEYTDEYAAKTEYTYDDCYRVKTEKTDSETTTYTYDDKGNVLSYETGNAENDTYYTYDAKGNVIREKTGNTASYYTYDSNKNVLVSATLKEDYKGEMPQAYDAGLTDCFDTISYTYDENGRVTKEEDSTGSVCQYEYDESGNVLKETSTVTENDKTETTVTTYTYDEMGNVLTTQCDKENSSYIYDKAGRTLLSNDSGKCTRTIYDEYGRVVQEIAPEDYDSSKDGLPNENTYADANVGQRYEYDEQTGNLTSETNRLNVKTSYTYYSTGEKKLESFDIYEYNYLRHGEIESVKIAGSTTISYTYDDKYNLLSENYANGDKLRYEYDNNNNLVKQYYNEESEAFVTYSYNAENELTQKVNTDSGLKYVYGENNKVEVYRTSDNTLVQSYTETITESDEGKNIEEKTEIDRTWQDRYYSSVIKKNSIKHHADGQTITYEYSTDDNDMIISDKIGCLGDGYLTADYEYDDNDNIVKKSFNNGEFAESDYDSDGKIENIYYKNRREHFEYDSKNQLWYFDNGDGYCAEYIYDDRGNITNKISSDEEEMMFTYEEDSWNDMLISVNNDVISYDAVGNIVDYGNKTFSWTSGRLLDSIVDGENQYYYTYDENGIRTSKIINGVKTDYYTKDGVILAQSDGTNEMSFQYDMNGTPIGFVYNDIQFLYMTNQMGDVIGITAYNGTIIASYKYDAWGKTIAIEVDEEIQKWGDFESIAQANPIRYRGYYYDNETGYYYLQSRYYDPSICRFINADIPDIAKVSKDDINGMNIYIYCNNDPVNHVDPTGYWLKDAHYSWTLSWINYYRDRDYYIGFIGSYSIVIANNCRRLDIDYPSTYYAKHPWEKNSKRWQYFHFNGNPNGTDSRIKYSNDMLKNAIQSWKYNKTRALLYLGYGLHAIQDIEAHGQIGRGTNIPAHGVTADNENYVWVDKVHKDLRRKRKGDRSRKTDTKIATYNYLRRFCLAIWRK